MITLKSLLAQAKERLANVSTAQLDAELLLAHVLMVSREFLYAWPEKEIFVAQQTRFLALVERRYAGEPIAYILGGKEFWGRQFLVNTDVLIPRPDTEMLVEKVLSKLGHLEKLNVIDLGTGSGAIAITLKKEKPSWQVYAADLNANALKIANLNAKKLNATIHLMQADWGQPLRANQIDIIVSNPPYIDKDDADLEKAVRDYEPYQALIADQQGYADLLTIISTAKRVLKPEGHLFLEHGFKQAPQLKKRLSDCGYYNIDVYQDLAGLDRVTYGCAPTLFDFK